MKKTALPIAALIVVGVVLFWFLRREADPSDHSPPHASGVGAVETIRAPRGYAEIQLPPAQGESTLRGRVLDPNGAPVEGALVVATSGVTTEDLAGLECKCGFACGKRLLECGCGEAAKQLSALVTERLGEAPPLARTRSAPDGSFELKGLAPGSVTLWAEKASVGVAVLENVATEGAPDVSLVGVARFEGRVTDLDEQPISGALVTAIHTDHSRYFDVLSDQTGRFVLPPMPDGKLRLVAMAPGFLPADAFVPETGPALVKMERPLRIAGNVLEAGRAVAGVSVDIEGEHRKESSVSDEQGAFHFSGLRRGSYSLSVRSGERGAKLAVRLEKDDADGLTLELGRLQLVRARVRSEAGTGVEGATVTLYTGRYDVAAEEKTDVGGQVSLRVHGAGSYRIDVDAEGFVSPPAKELVVSETSNEEFSFVLSPASIVEGEIADEAGRPIEKARISLRTPDDEETRFDSGSASSDAHGAFKLSTLPPGQYQYRVDADGYWRTEGRVQLPTERVRWVLRTGLELRGKVLDADGRPRSRVKITSASAAHRRDYDRSAAEASSDDEGRFLLKGLEAGANLITASAKTDGISQWQMVEATVPFPGELVVRFRGRERLEGVVETPEGVPVGGARISLEAEKGAAISTSSGASAVSSLDGRFRLTGIDDGRYSLSVWKEGFVAAKSLPVVIPGSAELVRVVLAGQNLITGRVLSATGAGVPHFLVGYSETSMRGVRDASGRFELAALEKSGVDLLIDAKGHARTRVPLPKSIAGKHDLGDIRLVVGGKLTGTVVDEGGEPVVGAALRQGVAWWSTGAPITSDEGGRFTLEEMGDEPIALSVVHPKFASWSGAVKRSSAPLRIVLNPGAQVSGRVAAASGAVPKSARVSASGSDEEILEMAKVKPDGTYLLERLPTGEVRLRVSHEDPTAPTFLSKTLRVKSGQTQRVDFVGAPSGCDFALALTTAAGAPYGEWAAILVGDYPMPMNIQAWRSGSGSAAMANKTPTGLAFSALPPNLYTLFVFGSHPAGLPIYREVLDLTKSCPKRFSRQLTAEPSLLAWEEN